jgi:hypothetical protein
MTDSPRARRTPLHEAAMVGRLAKLRAALAAAGGPDGLDAGDARGCTAFHHACAGGHADCAKAAVKVGRGACHPSGSASRRWRRLTLAPSRAHGSSSTVKPGCRSQQMVPNNGL